MRYLTKKIFPILAIIIALGCIVSLAACGVATGAKVIVTIKDNVRVEDFCLEDAFIEIINKNGKTETINVTADMLSADDLAKLSTYGRHTVIINYKKNKSITTDINLLRDVEDTDTVINKIIQGFIKSAPNTNINGELEALAYYEIGGHRTEYGISLKFTLDADSEAGTDSYLGLEITENNNVILAVYYKDSKTERPQIYIKFDGPFVPLMDRTENKFDCVSVDSYFGGAIESLAAEFFPDQSLKGIMDLITTIVSNDAVESLVTMVLQMILTNPAIAQDNTAATVDIDLGMIATIAPLVALIPEINNVANDFLSANNAGFGLVDVLTSLDVPPVLRINALFDNVTGALQKLDISDKKGNLSIFPMLQINIDGKGEAGLSIEKLVIKADKSSFELPADKGIEKWAEAEVSFERWVLLQYRRMLGDPVRPSNRAGTTNYLDIDYVGNANPYQYLDVYRPTEKAGETLPVIINIHGGGWVHGSKEGSYSYCQYLALQGFAVVNINYHLIPAAVMPVPMQDIFAAFNFVMDAGNAVLYGFDTDNVFLTGDSAGGHYALLALSVLADPALSSIYGVSSNIRFAAAGVNSTGFSFTDVLKIPLPFAHFYVNQFFSDDLPYTAYRDDPRYQAMAASLSLENNKLELLPPIFISSADGDGFNAHSDMLAAELKARGVEYVYDFRYQSDKDNPERFFLGHDFNISFPDWTVSRKVNNNMCSFFKAHIA